MLASLAGAWRSLRRNPRFTASAVGLLASTLTAVALVATLHTAVALRPLPFVQPEGLVAVNATVLRDTLERRAFARPDFIDYRERLAAVAELAGYSTVSATLRGAGSPRVSAGEVVDPEYFGLLGSTPGVGRVFRAETADAASVLISHRLWQERFQGSPQVLGQGVQIDGGSFTIVGVLPEGFHGVTGTADLWVSFESPLVSEGLRDNRRNRWHEAVGRLRPGRSLESLTSGLATVGAQLAAQFPDSNAGYAATARTLREELLGSQRDASRTVAIAIAALALIALLNLGGLALVRASARSFEYAMRRCLGASRGRLWMDLLGEGAIVGALASVLAALLAATLAETLPAWLPITLPSYVRIAASVDVLAALVAAATLAGAATFALSGWAVQRAELHGVKAGNRATASTRLRRAVVGAEIALGIVLLAGALMFTRSLAQIDALDPGYRVDGMVVLDFRLPNDRYPSEAARAFAQSLAARAREQPGVTAVGLSTDSPLGNQTSANMVSSDRLEPVPTRVYRHGVSADFFAASGLQLLAGEPVTDRAEPDAARTAVIAKALAEKLWPGLDPVGRRLKMGAAGSEAPWMTVVGVVEDARWRGLPAGPTGDSDFYYSLAQIPDRNFSLVARVESPATTLPALVRALGTVDAEVPVYAAQTLEQRVRQATEIPRFLALLAAGFAAMALLLSALGVYAIAALEAQQRVRELAIRQAVGATPRVLVRGFVADYGRVFAVAIAAGLLAIVPLSGVLQAQLFGVDALDPLSIAGSVSSFAAALFAGLLLPLRRVLGASPAVLMRAD